MEVENKYNEMLYFISGSDFPHVFTDFSILPSNTLSLVCKNAFLNDQDIPTDLSYLKMIKYIDFSHNNLTFCPIMSSELETLIISNNIIKFFDNLEILYPNLKVFDCSNNLLKSLPILPHSITSIYCQNNQIFIYHNLMYHTLLHTFIYDDVVDYDDDSYDYYEKIYNADTETEDMVENELEGCLSNMTISNQP